MASMWFLISALCIITDQLTKLIIFTYNLHLELLPFLSLTPTYNRGFVFGIFQNSEGWLKDIFYYGIPFAVVLVLFKILLKAKNPLVGFSVALILGGGIGNLIDRIVLGKVRDFIDFHIGQWHYPAFNIADSCVSIGIAILLFHFLLLDKKEASRGGV